MRKIIQAVVVVMALFPSATMAQDFDAGILAYARGDYETALKEWVPLAEQGESDPFGPTIEPEEFKYDPSDPFGPTIERSRERKDRDLADTKSKAQFYLGVMYEFGKGVAQDKAEAVRWYRLAAEQGDAAAQKNLGVMYEFGEGVAQDKAEAVRWFRLAAEQGHASVQFNLGVMYNNGRGVTQDYAEALRWYKLAAEQGQALAQNNLGLMYDEGEGVTQDYVRAHMWYNIAAANGSDQKNRDLIAKKMTPADMSKAQAMARKCLESGYKSCGG